MPSKAVDRIPKLAKRFETQIKARLREKDEEHKRKREEKVQARSAPPNSRVERTRDESSV